MTEPSLPFAPGQTAKPDIPSLSWDVDQVVPQPSEVAFRKGYHDYTFKSYSAPLAFEGFTLERVRNAITQHRLGIFLETSQLAFSALAFPPIAAALAQRMAPVFDLPRVVHYKTRGISRRLGEEVQEQIAPRLGLQPSAYFPPQLWAGMYFDRVMMGFSVLQHVFGDPDPETGVMPLYTRRWPTWAVNYYRAQRKFVALTTDGPVDICNDGKFTLVAMHDEPHFFGAIIPLGEEALDGKFTQRARASYVQMYGNPKWVGTMPSGVGVESPEGNLFFQAIQALRNPDGVAVFPYGAESKVEGLDGAQSTTFKDSLDSNWQSVAAILLGSDATLTKGTGVYSSPMYNNVRRDFVKADLSCLCHAANLGHVHTYLSVNYKETMAEARGFERPVVDIPLPDPDADARVDAEAKRIATLHALVTSERAAGFEMNQDRVNQLAKTLDIDAPQLADMLTAALGNLPPAQQQDKSKDSSGDKPSEPTEGEKQPKPSGTGAQENT